MPWTSISALAANRNLTISSWLAWEAWCSAVHLKLSWIPTSTLQIMRCVMSRRSLQDVRRVIDWSRAIFPLYWLLTTFCTELSFSKKVDARVFKSDFCRKLSRYSCLRFLEWWNWWCYASIEVCTTIAYGLLYFNLRINSQRDGNCAEGEIKIQFQDKHSMICFHFSYPNASNSLTTLSLPLAQAIIRGVLWNWSIWLRSHAASAALFIVFKSPAIKVVANWYWNLGCTELDILEKCDSKLWLVTDLIGQPCVFWCRLY